MRWLNTNRISAFPKIGMVKIWHLHVYENGVISLPDSLTQRHVGPRQPTSPYHSRTFRPIHISDHDNRKMKWKPYIITNFTILEVNNNRNKIMKELRCWNWYVSLGLFKVSPSYIILKSRANKQAYWYVIITQKKTVKGLRMIRSLCYVHRKILTSL